MKADAGIKTKTRKKENGKKETGTRKMQARQAILF
jgi:hypothetical protein